jgi:hypothetical protein
MGYLLSEIRRFQKIAGLLTEDDYTIPDNARSGDTAVMGNIAEEDLDLSDTPEFNKMPNLWDEAFRDFVWDYIGDYHEHKFGETDPEDVSDIVGQYLQNLRYDEVEALWSDYIKDKRANLRENDIDLADTPKFNAENFKAIFTPLLRKEGVRDDKYYNLILRGYRTLSMGYMESKLLKKVEGRDIPEVYEKIVTDYDWDDRGSIQYLEDTIEGLGVAEGFPGGCLGPSPSEGGTVSLLVSDDTVLDIVEAPVKENDIDLSDTPKFADEKKQFYVYDIEGMEPPLGPCTLEHARRVIRGLSASGEDYGIVNGEVAREIWNLEEDIDLSDTPKFSGLPSVDDVFYDPSFTSFVDNEYWLNNRFGFAEIKGRVYYIPDLDEDEMKVIPLRKGISLNRLIKAGKDKGYFLEDRAGSTPYGIYDTKLKQEIDQWINSLI